MKIGFWARKPTRVSMSRARGRRLRRLDDLLLHDLLHGPLLPALVVFLRREPVTARIAHDRIARDHLAARRAGDLPRLALGGLLLQPVTARIAHDRIARDHRAARRAGDLAALP